MSSGISANPLNPLSQVYLDKISEGRLKQLEKASALSASDNPDDQDKARAIRVRHDYESLKKQIGSKKRPIKPAVKEGIVDEGFSDWRTDLREIVTDASAEEDIADEPKIAEKKVKNKIKINPTFKESAQEVAENLGGQLLHVEEVDDEETDKRRLEREKQKEQMMKKRIIRMKLRAVNSGDAEGIVAGYEPDIDGAVEYFYEEGINEEGLEQLIEDIGLVDFIDFIDDGTAVELNEERAARKASVRAKKYDVVKKEVDKADAARKASKKGEYAPSYAKKETDVTVYDDKPSAKKKAPVKKAPTKKVSKKDYDGDGKKETPKAEHRGVRNKKITKAVAKVKKTQPAKKPSKEGLGDKIRSAYKAGVKRHRKATQGARVFGKGFAKGVKTAVKVAKDVKKVVSEEELNERLGGKGYKPRKDYAGRRVSGDWEDSDRGAGNKAKKRAGGTVKKKSPTYQAYVLNKEENVFKAAMKKVLKKKDQERKPEKAMDAGARAKRVLQRKEYASKVSGSTENVPDDIRDHYEVENLKEYSPNVTYQAKGGRKSGKLGKSSVYSLKDKGESKKEFRKSQVKDIKGGYLKTEEVVDEGKKKGLWDNIHAKRKRGEKPAKPGDKDYPKTLNVEGLKQARKNVGADTCWDGYKAKGTKKKGGKEVPNCVKEEDKALEYVRKKYKGQIYDPKKKQSPEDKAKVAAERKKRQDADNKAYASRAKKAGFKSTQDYTNVVARYGSEDNYKKGKGLGT